MNWMHDACLWSIPYGELRTAPPNMFMSSSLCTCDDDMTDGGRCAMHVFCRFCGVSFAAHVKDKRRPNMVIVVVYV